MITDLEADLLVYTVEERIRDIEYVINEYTNGNYTAEDLLEAIMEDANYIYSAGEEYE